MMSMSKNMFFTIGICSMQGPHALLHSGKCCIMQIPFTICMQSCICRVIITSQSFIGKSRVTWSLARFSCPAIYHLVLWGGGKGSPYNPGKKLVQEKKAGKTEVTISTIQSVCTSSSYVRMMAVLRCRMFPGSSCTVTEWSELYARASCSLAHLMITSCFDV